MNEILCDSCKQLRERHEEYIVCNIQCAEMDNVYECSFYERKEVLE